MQILTVRSTAFEAAVPADGTCDTEVLTAPADLPAISEYVGQELTKSDRPDLSSAKVCSFNFLENKTMIVVRALAWSHDPAN